MELEVNKIYQGDVLQVLKTFPDEFVDCIVTSPPYYGLRDYGVEGQIGLEKTLNEYLDKMLAITAELKRVLKKTGTMWWNHGDSYASLGRVGGDIDVDEGMDINRGRGRIKKGDYPEKSLLLQAHRLAIRMIDEQGWILRNTIIWHKPNVMPSSVKDRFTVDYEPVFFFTKAKRYWFGQQFESTIELYSEKRARRPQTSHGKEPTPSGNSNNLTYNKLFPLGRNKRSVWKIATKLYKEAHFATFPPELITIPIKAGCPLNGIVLDSFMGSGTTAYVARQLGRNYIGIELNPEYIKMAEKRFAQQILT